MIKLIASDLDGTLLQNEATQVAPSVFRLIKELKEKGILFVIASGRQYHNLRLKFEPVKDDIAYICENGAVVVYQDEIIYQYEFPKELGNKIIKKILAHEDTEALLSGVNNSFVQPKNKEFADLLTEMGNLTKVVEDLTKVEESYVKIAMYNERGVDQMQEYFNQQFGPTARVVTSGTLWLDVIMPGIDKSKGMSMLQEKLGINSSEIMAFGDNFNDLEMLSALEHSVAVENAKQGIKDVCKYETDTVEHMVRRYLNGELNI